MKEEVKEEVKEEAAPAAKRTATRGGGAKAPRRSPRWPLQIHPQPQVKACATNMTCLCAVHRAPNEESPPPRDERRR